MAINVAQLFPPNWQACFDPRFRRIGAGYDVATTTNKVSNPGCIALCQPCNDIFYMRLVLLFKTREPKVVFEVFRHIARNLPHGLKIGKLCIDATSEKFFATILKEILAELGISVELVDSSARIVYGAEKMNYKAYLGNMLANDFAEGKIAFPEFEWANKSVRQVVRSKGTFTADVDAAGNHADVFDALKLARHSVSGAASAAEAEAAGTGGELYKRERRRGDPRFENLNERLFT